MTLPIYMAGTLLPAALLLAAFSVMRFIPKRMPSTRLFVMSAIWPVTAPLLALSLLLVIISREIRDDVKADLIRKGY